jgi:hypothetical protein
VFASSSGTPVPAPNGSRPVFRKPYAQAIESSKKSVSGVSDDVCPTNVVEPPGASADVAPVPVRA